MNSPTTSKNLRQSPALPMLLMVGFTIILLGASIDLIGNTSAWLYKTLKPHLIHLGRLTLESLSYSLVATGTRLERYFYHIPTDSGSIASVIDAFYCGAMVDIGRCMRDIGRRFEGRKKPPLWEGLKDIWE